MPYTNPASFEPLLISLLFAVAAVAFIGVLNARGLWRTIVASLLALLCLSVAVFHTARYRAYLSAGIGAPAPVSAPATESGSGPDYAGESGGSSEVDLRELLGAARTLHDSLQAEDPTRARALPDSAYQAFENRTEAYLTRSRQLRERVARIAADPPVGLDEAAEFLNLSIQPLVTSARDLNAFFHAESKDEERRLSDSFRRNVQTADTPLSQAESRLGAGPAAAEPGAR